MTLQEAKMFVRNAKHYIEVFGEELFEKVVANYKIEDFISFEYVIRGEGQDAYYARMGYPVANDGITHTFKEYKGEWTREVVYPARRYKIPNPYQTNEKDLLRDCILLVNPNMANYHMNIYHLDKPTDDIYVKCDNGKSLYVPVMAIINKDYSLVENRMKTYWPSYYNTPDRKKYLDAELATLETETAKALRKTIEEGVPYICDGVIKKSPICHRTIRVSFDVVLDGTAEEIEKKINNNLKYSIFTDYTNVEIKEV